VNTNRYSADVVLSLSANVRLKISLWLFSNSVQNFCSENDSDRILPRRIIQQAGFLTACSASPAATILPAHYHHRLPETRQVTLFHHVFKSWTLRSSVTVTMSVVLYPGCHLSGFCSRQASRVGPSMSRSVITIDPGASFDDFWYRGPCQSAIPHTTSP